jgi:hypothetical protein
LATPVAKEKALAMEGKGKLVVERKITFNGRNRIVQYRNGCEI